MQQIKDLIPLTIALKMGYGSSLRSLQRGAESGELKTIKPAKAWLTTKTWLDEASTAHRKINWEKKTSNEQKNIPKT